MRDNLRKERKSAATPQIAAGNDTGLSGNLGSTSTIELDFNYPKLGTVILLDHLFNQVCRASNTAGTFNTHLDYLRL
jgi:hypothetical protein